MNTFLDYRKTGKLFAVFAKWNCVEVEYLNEWSSVYAKNYFDLLDTYHGGSRLKMISVMLRSDSSTVLNDPEKVHLLCSYFKGTYKSASHDIKHTFAYQIFPR